MSTAGMLGVRLTGEAWWCMFSTLWAEDSTNRMNVFKTTDKSSMIQSEIISQGPRK